MIGPIEDSTRRIQEAIDAGFTPVLRLVYVDDPRVTLRRAVARAAKNDCPVSIRTMAKLYADLPDTVAERRFGDKLEVRVFDNSVNGQAPKSITLDEALTKTQEYAVAKTEGELLDGLNKLHDSGEVSASPYDAFRGNSTAAPLAKGGSGRG